jgi:hypothetical protein
MRELVLLHRIALSPVLFQMYASEPLEAVTRIVIALARVDGYRMMGAHLGSREPVHMPGGVAQLPADQYTPLGRAVVNHDNLFV